MFDRKSDYALNKQDPEAIVCKSVTDIHIRLIRLDFASPEEFERWKRWSDENYRTGRDPVPEGMGKGNQMCRSGVRPTSERKHRLIEAVETEGLIRCICKELVLLIVIKQMPGCLKQPGIYRFCIFYVSSGPVLRENCFFPLNFSRSK